MRALLRTSLTLLALSLPLAQVGAQKAGKDIALDFSMSNSTAGTIDTAAVTGRMVTSGNRVRMDMKGEGAGIPVAPMPGATAVSIIVTDSGKTLTYMDAANRTYMRMRPAEMIENVQKMGGMTMQFSATEAKVQNLGPGPSIIGYRTAHYLVTTGVTIAMNAMGRQQTVQIASKTDYYFAADLPSAQNPFAAMSGSDMGTMFGATNKEFMDKMRAAQAQLPKAIPLRTLTEATVTADGKPQTTKTRTDVTAIRWMTADPKSFVVPADYKALAMPGMGSGGPK